MKKWFLFILLMGSLIQSAYAVDAQRFCQSGVAANTERAAWGLDLRIQMLDSCAGENLRICSESYRNQIIRQEQIDQAALQEQLKQQPVSDLRRYLFQKISMQKTTAAYMALRGVRDTPEAIAQEIYADCVTSLPVDLNAIANQGASMSTATPACSNYSGTDAQYRQRCCTPDCYCDVYCQ